MNNNPNVSNGQVLGVSEQPTPATTVVPVNSTPVTPATSVTPTVPVAPAVPTAVQTAPTVAQPASNTTPQPTEQRVKLVNDKVSLNAISQADMEQKTAATSEKVEESTDNPVENNKSGGGFQSIFLILLFGGLLAFIIYIDDITVYLESRKANKNQVVEKITTGTLACESERTANDMDYSYIVKFEFRDNRLKRLNYAMEIRGDINLDEEKLTKLNNECLLVKEYASKLNGIDITCSLENGLLKEKQVFTYDSINREEAMSAFIEAGGVYPEYRADQDIDEIEREMNAAAYTCKRLK